MKKLLVMSALENMEMVSTYKNVKDLAKFSYQKYESERVYDEKDLVRFFGLSFTIVNMVKILDIENVDSSFEDIDWIRGVDKKAISNHIKKNYGVYEQSEEAYILRGLVKNSYSLGVISELMMDYNLKQSGLSLGELIISIEEQKEVTGVKEIIVVKNSVSFKKSDLEKVTLNKQGIEASISIIRKFNKIINGEFEKNSSGIIISGRGQL